MLKFILNQNNCHYIRKIWYFSVCLAPEVYINTYTHIYKYTVPNIDLIIPCFYVKDLLVKVNVKMFEYLCILYKFSSCIRQN